MPSLPDAWGFIPPETIPCPCYGDVETCELCQGTGSVIADQPVTVPVDIKVTVLEARYAAGLPLFRPDDGFIPPDKSRGGPDWDAFFESGETSEDEPADDADDDFADPEWA